MRETTQLKLGVNERRFSLTPRLNEVNKRQTPIRNSNSVTVSTVSANLVHFAKIDPAISGNKPSHIGPVFQSACRSAPFPLCRLLLPILARK